MSGITSNAATTISGGTVTTTGSQLYNNPLILGANSTFNTTNSAVSFGSIDRNGTASNLTVNSGSGAITLGGNIGSGANGALGAISLTSSGTTTVSGTIKAGSLAFNTDSTGTTQIDSTSIVTTGNQVYGNPVSLLSSPVIKSGSGTITFDGFVSGIGQTLTLQDNTAASTGAVTFDGNVTLANLITFGGSANYAVNMDGSTNTFANAVTFNNATTLGNSTTDTFNFDGGVTNTAGTTTVDGIINSSGNSIDLGAVTVNGNTSLNSTGGAVSIRRCK